MFDSVKDAFNEFFSDSAPTTEWLPRALAHPSGQHLSICLSIEMLARLIEPSDIKQLIASPPADVSSVPAMFSTAVKSYPDLPRLLGAKDPRFAPPKDDSYVRVLKLSTFVSYCLAPRYSGDSLDLAEAQEAYFPNSFTELEHGLGLSCVVSWTTSRDIIWVTSYNEFWRAIGGSTSKMGSVANDGLGLGYVNKGDDKPLLIAVKYPQDPGISTFRPKVFMADWSGQTTYYLSAVDDPSWIGWGRTHSCTGHGQELPERVHNGLSGLTDDFVGGILGPIDDLGEIDYPSLIQDGLARLAAAGKPDPDAAL